MKDTIKQVQGFIKDGVKDADAIPQTDYSPRTYKKLKYVIKNGDASVLETVSINKAYTDTKNNKISGTTAKLIETLETAIKFLKTADKDIIKHRSAWDGEYDNNTESQRYRQTFDSIHSGLIISANELNDLPDKLCYQEYEDTISIHEMPLKDRFDAVKNGAVVHLSPNEKITDEFNLLWKEYKFKERSRLHVVTKPTSPFFCPFRSSDNDENYKKWKDWLNSNPSVIEKIAKIKKKFVLINKDDHRLVKYALYKSKL